jgi:6-phosphogluconolactonase/glucosamine-6-phosphate isomerase/deaminase
VQVDERVAPDGHPDRNATQLRAFLTDRVDLPAQNLHLLSVGADDLGAGAAADASMLARLGGVLDVVHLGLGDDGHTASWPPGDPVIDMTDRAVAVVGPFNGHLRLTLTPPVIAAARRVVWLVTGASKADVLARLVGRDPGIPATRVPADRAEVVCDEPAAGNLSSR